MERLNEDKARIFDSFYSSDNLNMLKICSFFMHEKERPMIAVLIKYMELHICMQKSMRNHEIPTSCNCSGKESNLEDILCEIGDYLPPEGRDMMDKLKDMKENMEMYSQMMEMMSMMNEQPSNTDES